MMAWALFNFRRRISRINHIATSSEVSSPLSYLNELIFYVMIFLGGLLMSSTVIFYILVPVAYDTIHLQDTLFFAELGWRVLNGAEPTVDFNHFYGGVVAQYVAWSFDLFGITVKSIDYAFVLMLSSALGLVILVSWRRLSAISVFALCLVVVTCCLTRVPLEYLTAIQRPTSAHSLIYNRFAAGLAITLIVFALVPSRDSIFDRITAVFCGAVLYLVVLIKPTFVTFAPTFLLAIWIRGRWQLLGFTCLGLVGGILLLDPGFTKVANAFLYALEANPQGAGVAHLILKTAAVFLVHPLTLLLVLSALIVGVLYTDRQPIQLALSTMLLAVGYAGMTATMGWSGDVGQQALPLLVALPIAFFERAKRETTVQNQGRTYLRVVMALIAMAFTLPHLAQSTLSSLVGMARAPLALMHGTPLESYLAWSDEFVLEDGRKIRTPVPLAEQAVSAKAHILSGAKTNVGVEYVMIADGIELLKGIPDLQDRRLAGDYGVFSFAMQTRPVNSFPVWVSSESPDFAAGNPLDPVIDLMMIRRLNKSKTSRLLLAKMEGQFSLCKSSIFWELHMRNARQTELCGTK